MVFRRIMSIDRGNLVEYINKNYQADRMVLVNAGGVPHENRVNLAEKHFGKIPPSGTFRELGREGQTKPQFIGSEVKIRDDTMQHAHIAFAVEDINILITGRCWSCWLSSVTGIVHWKLCLILAVVCRLWL